MINNIKFNKCYHNTNIGWGKSNHPMFCCCFFCNEKLSNRVITFAPPYITNSSTYIEFTYIEGF